MSDTEQTSSRDPKLAKFVAYVGFPALIIAAVAVLIAAWAASKQVDAANEKVADLLARIGKAEARADQLEHETADVQTIVTRLHKLDPQQLRVVLALVERPELREVLESAKLRDRIDEARDEAMKANARITAMAATTQPVRRRSAEEVTASINAKIAALPEDDAEARWRARAPGQKELDDANREFDEAVRNARKGISEKDAVRRAKAESDRAVERSRLLDAPQQDTKRDAEVAAEEKALLDAQQVGK